MNGNRNLLTVENLRTYFNTEEGLIKAVDGVDFEVKKGETLGVVGESGCGKSVTALSIMQLIPRRKAYIAEGKILYNRKDGDHVDITSLHPHGQQMRSLRGNEIAMIFQEPMSSLNPVYTIGAQIMEVIQLHQKLDKRNARERALQMLKKVGISAPEQRIDEYPHQFSGGMRQRVMIAMALSCDPNFLIADEPTTALDVTVEAQILQLMQDLQNEMGMSIMIITHDLGIIGEMADRVIVMYTGKIVESASTDDIFYNPKHPYTIGLLQSIPQIGEKKELTQIKGTVPNPHSLPEGCYFAPRCPQAMEKCKNNAPQLGQIGNEHSVSCWLYSEEEAAVVEGN